MVKISSAAIDPLKIYDLIDAGGAGSVVLHFAVVKPMVGDGGTTSYIEYADGGDAEGELRDIAAALKNDFSLQDVLLIRRTGRLGLGDIISLVAVSSPNSEDAFGACQQGIRCMKKMKTIIKNEVCG